MKFCNCQLTVSAILLQLIKLSKAIHATTHENISCGTILEREGEEEDEEEDGKEGWLLLYTETVPSLSPTTL